MEKPKGFDNFDIWPSRYDEYIAYINSETWRDLRLKRLRHDGMKCTICGRPEQLQVHHIIYPRIYGTETIQDLITLCPNCHQIIEKLKKSGTAKFKPYETAKLYICIKREDLSEFENSKGKIETILRGGGNIPVWIYLKKHNISTECYQTTLNKYSALVDEFGADVSLNIDKTYGG